MKKNYYHIINESNYDYIFRNLTIKKSKNYIFFLTGEVGSGKSTFIRLFIKYIYMMI